MRDKKVISPLVKKKGLISYWATGHTLSLFSLFSSRLSLVLSVDHNKSPAELRRGDPSNSPPPLTLSLSLSQLPSLSLIASLSLSHSCFSLLDEDHYLCAISDNDGVYSHKHRRKGFRWRRIQGRQLLSRRSAANDGDGLSVGKPRRSNSEMPSLTTLTTILGDNQFSLASYFQWYPPFVMKVSESPTYFFVWKRKTLPVDLSQTEPYFEVTILNSCSWQNILSNGIYYVYDWCRLQKVTFFKTNYQKCQFNFASFACKANWDSE